jgi:hypothetical protein
VEEHWSVIGGRCTRLHPALCKKWEKGIREKEAVKKRSRVMIGK